LSQVATDGIEEFKQARLEKGVGPATVNRDLAVLRRMLRLAKRQRLITHNPFDEVEFLEERKHRRQPHILTFEEEKRLLAVASPMMRALVVLIVETGLRIGKEAFPLEWKDVDLLNGTINIRESKTLAGRRQMPLSDNCKAELIQWRNSVGPQFSVYVFPNLANPKTHVKSVKKSWANTLKAARVNYFPIYNLRATFASRLSAAGAPDVFIAQMMGTPHVNMRAQFTSRRGVMTAKDLQLRLYSFRRLTLVQYCTWSLV
jgi:integrase